MAQEANSSWGPADHDTLSLNLPADDFADFLNLDSLDASFPYPLFDGANRTPHNPRQFGNQTHASSNVQGMYRPDLTPDPFGSYAGDGTYAHSAYDHGGSGSHGVGGNMFPQPNYAAPPTPNSAPMYAKGTDYYNSTRNLSQYGSGNLDSRAHLTTTSSPFVSPELDGCASAISHTPDYPVSGVYNLSPLTSPAMQPQLFVDDRQDLADNNPQLRSSNTNDWSKADQELDTDEARPRKTRKRGSVQTSGSSSTTRSRKAPTSAPKRNGSLASHQKLAQLEKDKPQQRQDDTLHSNYHSSSASNSISPRPLDEVLMGPPLKPISASASSAPIVRAKTTEVMSAGPPATPASIMGYKTQTSRLSSGDDLTTNALQHFGHDARAAESGLEFLELPEAAASMVEDASGLASSATTNEVRGASNRSLNRDTVPERDPPVLPKGSSDGYKPKGKAIQASKKRNSNGSALVSPALRPKLSPNVKPLLPEGASIDSETHALLLASRSNYENILSGSHLPGISYPADLGANLTSKRTSHKLAEQGRRNRINVALQEMQTLLPAKFTATLAASKDLDKGDTTGNGSSSAGRPALTATQSGNSKAATVECAIEYIRHLQKESQLKGEAIEQMKGKSPDA